MERTQTIVIATVLAALLLFGLKFWSDRSEEEDEAIRVASRGGRSLAGGSEGGSESRPGRPGARSGSTARRPAANPSGSTRTEPSGDERFGRGGAGLARAVHGEGGRGSGSALGSSSSSSGSRAGGGSARLSGTGGKSPASEGRDEVRSGIQPDLLDSIASQPKGTTDPLAPDPLDPEGDVVLTVNNKEDTEKASENHAVKESDDNEGVTYNEETVLSFPDAGGASGDAGTISFDLQPEWGGAEDTNNALAQIQVENQWSNRVELVKNGRFLRFILTDNTGKETDISFPMDAWTAGDQHSITASWGEGKTNLYIDGQLVGQAEYPGRLEIPAGTPLHVGSKFNNYSGAKATMKNFNLSRKAFGS